MELLDGKNLQHLVERDKAQPAGRVVQILTQVCGALQEAHDAGMIHKDIKPANIILCERGGVPDVAKVVDYGLVQEIKSATADATKHVLGTPEYLAPENITDPGLVGPAVDLYALGATGYFLLTGELVFPGKTTSEITVAHITKQPRPFAEVTKNLVPPELELIIMKCLAKRPADRYESAAALAEALADVPDLGDWNRARAKQWWTEHKAQVAATPSADARTVTLTIELGARLTPVLADRLQPNGHAVATAPPTDPHSDEPPRESPKGAD
jgi:eukaryotic-like serine/threonine-protein kinase